MITQVMAMEYLRRFVTFNWTAATGTPRQYKLYGGKYRTGGIPGGLPLPVNQTIKSADPDTVLELTTLPYRFGPLRLRRACPASALDAW